MARLERQTRRYLGSLLRDRLVIGRLVHFTKPPAATAIMSGIQRNLISETARTGILESPSGMKCTLNAKIRGKTNSNAIFLEINEFILTEKIPV